MSAFDVDSVPTLDLTDGPTPREIRLCPGCGRPEPQWRENDGAGYQLGGEVFCCRGCADETGCTCR